MKRFIITLLSILLIINFSYSQVLKSTKKVGTTSAQFLKIGAGARPLSLGGAFSANVGDINSIYWNPIGLILLFCMLVFPFWIFYDLLKKQDTFLRFYKKTEANIKKKWILFPLIILILFNWIWNIYKEL